VAEVSVRGKGSNRSARLTEDNDIVTTITVDLPMTPLGVAAGLIIGLIIVYIGRQRRLGQLAAGKTARLPCRVKWPARGADWKPGRLLIGPEQFAWAPSRSGGAVITFPPDIEFKHVRDVMGKEGWKVNKRGMKIIECASSNGDVLIAVRKGETDLVEDAMGSA
jgi:hypothetical protein